MQTPERNEPDLVCPARHRGLPLLLDYCGRSFEIVFANAARVRTRTGRGGTKTRGGACVTVAGVLLTLAVIFLISILCAVVSAIDPDLARMREQARRED